MGKNQQKTRDRVCRIWNEQGRPKGGGWDHWQHAENQQIANGKDDSTKGDDNWKIEAGNPILTERGNKSLKFMVYDRVII